MIKVHRPLKSCHTIANLGTTCLKNGGPISWRIAKIILNLLYLWQVHIILAQLLDTKSSINFYIFFIVDLLIHGLVPLSFIFITKMFTQMKWMLNNVREKNLLWFVCTIIRRQFIFGYMPGQISFDDFGGHIFKDLVRCPLGRDGVYAPGGCFLPYSCHG